MHIYIYVLDDVLLCQQLLLDCANIETLERVRFSRSSFYLRITRGYIELSCLSSTTCVCTAVWVCMWVVCTGPVPSVGTEKSREVRNENRYYWSQWRFVSLRFLCLLRSRRIYTNTLIYKTVQFGGGASFGGKNSFDTYVVAYRM